MSYNLFSFKKMARLRTCHNLALTSKNKLAKRVFIKNNNISTLTSTIFLISTSIFTSTLTLNLPSIYTNINLQKAIVFFSLYLELVKVVKINIYSKNSKVFTIIKSRCKIRVLLLKKLDFENIQKKWQLHHSFLRQR